MGDPGTSEKKLDARGLRIGVIASRYNPGICEGLLAGAVEELKSLGLNPAEIPIYRVPGALELPFLAKTLAQTGKFDALICLGAVIRGETSHFEYVCQGTTQGMVQAMLDTGIPMSFGVVTTENEIQAVSRSSANENNKGREAARTAVEMVRVKREILTR